MGILRNENVCKLLLLMLHYLPLITLLRRVILISEIIWNTRSLNFFFWVLFCSEAVAWMCSFKKLFWKISVLKKFTGNYLSWDHFSSNTGGLGLHFYWNKYFIADVLLWILQKFSDQLFNRKTASSCLKNCC